MAQDDTMTVSLPEGIRTLADAARGDYTHLRIRCCSITDLPFELIRRPVGTPIVEIAPKLRCRRCGKQPKVVSVTAQHLAYGYVNHYPEYSAE